jgi:hypothetical protein
MYVRQCGYWYHQQKGVKPVSTPGGEQRAGQRSRGAHQATAEGPRQHPECVGGRRDCCLASALLDVRVRSSTTCDVCTRCELGGVQAGFQASANSTRQRLSQRPSPRLCTSSL